MSDAEEIFEGVLLKAKNEHEEKKTRIIGNIFVNTAFSEDFSAGEANHLLRIAENLTYREMCILSVVKRRDEISGIELRKDWLGEANPSVNSITIDFSKEKTSVLQQAFDIIPDELTLTIMGLKYYKIMGLDDIPEDDIREVVAYLN